MDIKLCVHINIESKFCDSISINYQFIHVSFYSIFLVFLFVSNFENLLFIDSQSRGILFDVASLLTFQLERKCLVLVRKCHTLAVRISMRILLS